MDPIAYFIADLYPWWGIPLAFILVEVANIYRRRGEKKKAMAYIFASGIFMALAVAYFAFNGFEKLRPAMRQVESAILQK